MINRTLWTADRIMSANGMDGRRQVDSIADAILVSSLTVNGLHAPTLDLDYPVKITEKTAPRAWVTFDMGGDKPSRPEWTRMVYQLLDARLIDDDQWSHVGKLMLAFIVPFELRSSTTRAHHHMYIDHELTWPVYENVLRAMRGILLEPGFVDCSIDRQQTMLLKPGLSKADLPALGVSVEHWSKGPEVDLQAPALDVELF